MENRIESSKRAIVDTSLDAFRKKLFAGTSGNLSIYIKDEDLMLITPTSLSYEIMQPEDIVVMRLDGEILSNNRQPSSEWRMHAAIYEKTDDIESVFHTHSPYATAFAAAHKSIPNALIELAPFIGGHVPCVPYEKPGTKELGITAAETMLKEERFGCLLSNHGVVAIGSDIAQAYIRAIYIEDAAKICHLASQIGEIYEI